MAKTRKPAKRKKAAPKQASTKPTVAAAPDLGSAEPPRRMGRPPKLEANEDTYERIMACAVTQMRKREAAAIFRVHPDTFGDFLRDNPEANMAWDNGVEFGKASLRRMQWATASKGNVRMQVWLGKQWLDQRDKIDSRHSGGDGGPVKVRTLSDFYAEQAPADEDDDDEAAPGDRPAN